jgi:hypothetical protein
MLTTCFKPINAPDLGSLVNKNGPSGFTVGKDLTYRNKKELQICNSQRF